MNPLTLNVPFGGAFFRRASAATRDDRTFGGSGPPMVTYRFEDSRATECVARHLSGYRGILQVDGYAAYNKLVRKDGGNDSAHSGWLLVTQPPEVLRVACRKQLKGRYRYRPADGKAVGD